MATGLNTIGQNQEDISLGVTAALPTREEKIAAARKCIEKVRANLKKRDYERGVAETAIQNPPLADIAVLREQTQNTLNDRD